MDDTEEYEAMYRAIDEIQERFRDPYDDIEDRDMYIHAPTQDELQDIYDAPTISILICEFYTFVFGDQFGTKEEKAETMEYSGIFRSMEQLWLGFVMQEKYGKQWDGKKWEKI